MATAARITGLSATVYLPRSTPEAKARRIAAQGARVVRRGDVYADAEAAARTWAQQSEPAAAVPFAAWLGRRVPGRHPCLVVCGANTDWHPR